MLPSLKEILRRYHDPRKFGRETGKLPTIWTDRKAQTGRRSEVEKMIKGDSQKSEDAGAEKGRKVAKHRVFPAF